MNYFLGIDASTGTLVADFEDTANGGNHPVTGTTAVTSNVWHHAAATYNATTGTWSSTSTARSTARSCWRGLPAAERRASSTLRSAPR